VSVLPPVEEEFIESGEAKLEVRPLAIVGEESSFAAQAALCANDQGMYWEFQDTLYANQAGENQGAYSIERLKLMAAALDMDTGSFNQCLDSRRYASAVAESTREARDAGVSKTPTILVNGQEVETSVEALREAILEALASGS
jgi:protein-disulfide isomerase